MIEIIAERILRQHLHLKGKGHAARRLAVSIAVHLPIHAAHTQDTVTTSTGAKDEGGVCQAVVGPVEGHHLDVGGTDGNTREVPGIRHGAGIPDPPAGTINRIHTRVGAFLVPEQMTKSSGVRIIDRPLATPQVH